MLDVYQAEVAVKAPLGANIGNNTQGGYFLKPTWYSEVWDKIREYPKLLERTDRYDITGNTLNINAINETSLADGSRHAGVLGYWVAEAASLTSTYPALTTIQAVLNTNVVFVYATNQLLFDANIESFDKKISELAMLELLWQEDYACISGSGSSQPLGILNQPALVTVAKNSGDTNAMFSFADLAAMFKALYPPSRPNAVWLMNPEAYAVLIQMAFQPAGSVSAGTYPAQGLTYNYMDELTPLRIFGIPVIECLMSPQLGTVFVDVSEHIQFATLQTAFRFYRRYDLRSPWPAALTSMDTKYSYSPFIALAARGT
jgi:HK97 family phage major capsid protein